MRDKYSRNVRSNLLNRQHTRGNKESPWRFFKAESISSLIIYGTMCVWRRFLHGETMRYRIPIDGLDRKKKWECERTSEMINFDETWKLGIARRQGRVDKRWKLNKTKADEVARCIIKTNKEWLEAQNRVGGGEALSTLQLELSESRARGFSRVETIERAVSSLD